MMDLISKLNEFMNDIGIDYALCGGHSIDLFLGEKTRPHKDLDVVVFWEDRNVIVQFMLNHGWDVYEPCGDSLLHKIIDVSKQKCVKSNIWCVKQGNKHYQFTEHDLGMYTVVCDDSEQIELDYIEFLFNTKKDGAFLYARNHDIKRSIDIAILKVNDIPILAPEIVLLYKSIDADNPEYQQDYENTRIKMSETQLAWLNGALSIMFPNGHKWLDH